MASWKKSAHRKPLIVRGARQVGKTHSLKAFAAAQFQRAHYVNFEVAPNAAAAFSESLRPSAVLRELGFLLKSSIEPGDLLILDEIQACPRALTSPKYFQEERPELAVCSAGSLLGVSQSAGSFPVGKVDFLDQMPLTFSEFLRALAEDEFAAHLQEAAKTVATVFQGMPSQLAKTNRKYTFSKAAPGGRFRQLKDPIDWLSAAGLTHKVPLCNSAEQPLSAFADNSSFVLYAFDVGILGALADLDPDTLVAANHAAEQRPFATFKGAFAENFVAQQLRARGHRLFSWRGSHSEIEFMCQFGGQAIPIEVKAGLSGKLKSLRVFEKKYAPPLTVRISARPLELNKESRFMNVPLYLTEHLEPLIGLMLSN